MQDQQQFEQLMLQYNQLKNGSEDIRYLIEREDFDAAISMIKAREAVFLNCKCMRRYLELTPTQEAELNEVLDVLRKSEMDNINILTEKMAKTQQDLRQTTQNVKFQNAYNQNNGLQGTMINVEE